MDSTPFFYVSPKLECRRAQKTFTMGIHIGEKIRAVLREQGRSVRWFQNQINRSHTAVYVIFKSQDINTDLLKTISIVLNHDFFKDLSDDVF